MTWIFVGAVALLVLLGYILYDPGSRNVGQSELADQLRAFAVSYENSSRLRILVHGSDIWLGVERTSGENRNVTLNLRFPRTVVDAMKLEEMAGRLKATGRKLTPEDDDLSIVARSEFVIGDTLRLRDYSEIARISREYFQVLGVDPNQRLTFAKYGRPRSVASRLGD